MFNSAIKRQELEHRKVSRKRLKKFLGFSKLLNIGLI